MSKNIISRTIALSILSIALVFVLSGCGKNKEQNKEIQKNSIKTETNEEELKKPLLQDDVDKELEAIDEDMKSILNEDLQDADLNESNL